MKIYEIVGSVLLGITFLTTGCSPRYSIDSERDGKDGHEEFHVSGQGGVHAESGETSDGQSYKKYEKLEALGSPEDIYKIMKGMKSPMAMALPYMVRDEFERTEFLYKARNARAKALERAYEKLSNEPNIDELFKRYEKCFAALYDKAAMPKQDGKAQKCDAARIAAADEIAGVVLGDFAEPQVKSVVYKSGFAEKYGIILPKNDTEPNGSALTSSKALAAQQILDELK